MSTLPNPLLIILCLALAGSAASAAQSNVLTLRPVVKSSGRVIVEFHGTPSALSGPGVRSIHRDTFARFRRDLTSTAAAGKAGIPRHEYSAVFLGAAVEISHSEIDRLRAAGR